MITIIKLHELFSSLSKKGMKQVFSDWEMLVGFEAKASAERIQIASSVAELSTFIDSRHLVVETKVEQGDSSLGSIYFAFPNLLVIEIIADLLMIPESARETKAKEGLSENDIEAFCEMANLLCGSWNRVFHELERDLRISQSVDDLNVWTDSKDAETVLDSCVEGGRVAYVPLRVECGGKEHAALLVLPFKVAISLAEHFYSDAA